jgi:hypothetical protein
VKTILSLVGVLPFLNGSPAVRMEPGGVRVGGDLVRGPALELREGLLVSGSAVEPLLAPVALEAARGRRLRLAPGVRAARAAEGVILSTHGGRALRLAAGSRRIAAESPLLLVPDESGWRLGEEALGDVEAFAQVAPQDDSDANLRVMQESARRMERRPGTPEVRRRRLFSGGDPTAGASPALDREVLQTLPRISPF